MPPAVAEAGRSPVVTVHITPSLLQRLARPAGQHQSTGDDGALRGRPATPVNLGLVEELDLSSQRLQRGKIKVSPSAELRERPLRSKDKSPSPTKKKERETYLDEPSSRAATRHSASTVLMPAAALTPSADQGSSTAGRGLTSNCRLKPQIVLTFSTLSKPLLFCPRYDFCHPPLFFFFFAFDTIPSPHLRFFL